MSSKKVSSHPNIVIPGNKATAMTTSTTNSEHEYAMKIGRDDHKDKRKEPSSIQNTPTKMSTKKLKDLTTRTSELERYKRRWNLRVIGMKEAADEAIREDVISLLAEIAPHLRHKLDDIVDTVHRVGPRQKDKSRQVIIQFCMRKYRDEFWRSTKFSDICKTKGIKFTEDLSKGDREARAALWPVISEARAAGKKAYYRGPYGYIEGTRIVKNS
ncbi:uncharacterized protein si:ch211-196c10.15 [Clarias gariepinus]|uniref:uncharacterized protein si:ch211-196c10.15 n=1 Tax=Clarias gariepinus TaxID=13013 RepID=UPI00234D8F71|nr:uncharacterized protein si:ch211-196c10.15 [Clarias gariepinus]